MQQHLYKVERSSQKWVFQYFQVLFPIQVQIQFKYSLMQMNLVNYLFILCSFYPTIFFNKNQNTVSGTEGTANKQIILTEKIRNENL